MDRGEMMRDLLRRWLRTLNAQITLWTILPVTLAFIALSFSGIYAHQRTMRDFVITRGMALARLTARATEDALGHGTIDLEGRDLAAWMPLLVGDHPGVIMIVNREGHILAHPDAALLYQSLAEVDITAMFQQREGYVFGPAGPTIQQDSLFMFASVTGTDWVVLVQEPVEGISDSILRFPNLAPIIATAAGVLSILMLTSSWFTIVRPLQRLSQAANQVSWSDLWALTKPVGGVQEIRDLQQAVQEMVERIRAYQAAIRDYAGEIARSQEAERTRLARELHDGPVQDLIVLGQRAEIAQRLADQGDGTRAAQIIQDLRATEQGIVDNLRNLIADLRPLYLEDLGFLPALEVLVQQARQRTTAQVTLEQHGQAWRLAPEADMAAYRIAQEALRNAVSHAQASRITVRVEYAPDGLHLVVSDDGLGFQVAIQPDALTRAGHFGLVGMQERAAILHGTLQVRSAPGQGTEIALYLPR